MKEFSFKQWLTTYNKLGEFMKEEDGKVGSKSVLVLGTFIGATLLGSALLDPFLPAQAAWHGDNSTYTDASPCDFSHVDGSLPLDLG